MDSKTTKFTTLHPPPFMLRFPAPLTTHLVSQGILMLGLTPGVGQDWQEGIGKNCCLWDIYDIFDTRMPETYDQGDSIVSTNVPT